MEEIYELLQEKMRRNAFAVTNGMELESIEQDRAVIRLEVKPESCNPMGFVHGGAMFTMADTAAGLSIFTDGRVYVTINGSLNYMHNVTGGIIRATGTVQHRGHTTAYAHVDVNSEDGTLLASGEFSFFCIDNLKKSHAAG